ACSPAHPSSAARARRTSPRARDPQGVHPPSFTETPASAGAFLLQLFEQKTARGAAARQKESPLTSFTRNGEREKGFEPSTSTLARGHPPRFAGILIATSSRKDGARRYPGDPTVTLKWCSGWCSAE